MAQPPPSAAAARCPACGGAAADLGRTLRGYRLARCLACDLVHAPAAIGEDVDYDAVYETDDYRTTQVDALRTSAEPASFADHPTYRPFFRHVPRAGAARLLDVGCGVGRFGHAATAHGWSVRGIDPSARAVAAGRDRAGFPIERATLDDVVARGERFDAVTAFEVLEHLDAPRAFLETCARALSASGRVFCTVPNWDCDDVRSATDLASVPPVHKLFFTRRALASVARAAGLDDVRVGTIDSDPMPRRPWNAARWLLRRLRGRRGPVPGLWLRARRGT